MKKAGACREDHRQGPKNKQPQPNLQPSLAKIDEGIGQGSKETGRTKAETS